MNENLSAGSTESAPIADRKPSHRKRNLLIGGGVALLLAAGSAFAVPAMVHASQLSKYTSTATAIVSAEQELADSKADLQAQIALTEAQRQEAQRHAKNMLALSKTSEPVLTKAQTSALKKSADSLTDAVASEVSDAHAEQRKQLTDRVEKMREADKKAAQKDKDAKESAPDSYLTLDLPTARTIADIEAGTGDFTPAQDASVNKNALSKATTILETTQAQLDMVDDDLNNSQAESKEILAAVAGTLPALEGAAKGAPAQAEKVAKAASQAQKQVDATTKAAKAAHKSALAGDSASEVRVLVQRYVDAAQAAQSAHTSAMQAEAAVAEVDSGWTGSDVTSDNYGYNTSPDTTITEQPVVDVPVSSPVDVPVEAPVDAPVEVPVDVPVSTPTQTPPTTTCPEGTYPTGSWDSTTGIHCLANGEGGW